MSEDEKSSTLYASDVCMNASRVSEQPLLPVLNISLKEQKVRTHDFLSA